MFDKKSQSVFGIFKDRAAAEFAVDRLKTEGFRNSDVSVLMPNPESTRNFAHEKNTKAPEGAAAGAGTGAGGALGGIAGALVGMGIPEYEAKRYEGHVKGGGTLLSVHVDNQTFADKAKRILKELDAQDISSAGEVAAAKVAKAS